MSINTEIKHIKNLIINPAKEWNSIASGSSFNKSGLWFFILLVVLSTVSGVCGRFIYALNHPVPLDYIPEAAANLLVPIITLYCSSFFLKIFSGKQPESTYSNALKLVGYSILPYLLITVIILLVRDLYFFGLFGLYSVYIFWTGLNSVLNISLSKRVGLLVLISMIYMLIYFFSELGIRFIIVNILA